MHSSTADMSSAASLLQGQGSDGALTLADRLPTEASTGDEVLRTFAITVFANIRTIDRFGRYGGEEFLLVLPDTPAEDAARILERLRTIIADLDWSAFSPGLRVTISAGLATLRPDEMSDSFLRAPTARFTQPRHEDATASPTIDQQVSISGDEELSPGCMPEPLQDRV